AACWPCAWTSSASLWPSEARVFMSLTAAVWIVILCALVMANLPFLLERRPAAWPWGAPPTRPRPAGLRWGLGLVFLAAVALWSWGTLTLVGGSFAGGGATTALFLVKLLFSLALAWALLALPGWRGGAGGGVKSFFDRLLEVLVGYVLVG